MIVDVTNSNYIVICTKLGATWRAGRTALKVYFLFFRFVPQLLLPM